MPINFKALTDHPTYVSVTTQSLLTNTLQVKQGPWADITAWGASTSGTPSSNSAAINAAIATGYPVLIPIGDFQYDSSLAIPLNCPDFFGYGYNSHLIYTGASRGITAGQGGSGNWEAALRNFRLTSLTGQDGIYLTDLSGFTISSVYVSGFSRGGLTANPATACINITIDGRCSFKGNGYGIYGTGANNLNRWAIKDSDIQGNSLGGIVADKICNGWAISGCEIEGNTGNQIAFLNGLHGVDIAGNYFEVTNTNDNVVQTAGAGNVQGLAIIGNYAQHDITPANGRFLYTTTSGTIDGLHVVGNAILGGFGFGPNPAIDGGGKLYFNSVLWPNSYTSGVLTKVGNIASFGTSIGTLGDTQTAYGRLDFPNIPAGTSADLTVPVGNASAGLEYEVTAYPTRTNSTGTIAALETGIVYNAFISAANTITLRLSNITTGAINPTERDWYFVVRTVF